MTESQSPSLATRVRDELLERLLSGRYAPGSRISIDELKVEYGVSKQPVMDALRRLETTGLVQIVPQSGCRVVAYSAEEVSDFFGLFAKFEGEIAAAAAQRRTPEQVDALAAAAAELAALDPTMDPAELAVACRRLNRRFHREIRAMACSRVMTELSERMWDLSEFLLATALGDEVTLADLSRRNEEHDLIRTAIAVGEADVARAAMETHIRGAIAPVD
jgi:DNA-binding GntR family transcriptional regulator